MKDIQGGEKKVMKKILSVALSTAMAFSMFASVAFAADAEKLTPEQQFNVLKEAGIVTGYPDGLSHLDRTVTRAELAKIIVKSMALEEVTGVASYKDKNYTAKHWAAPFIEAATQAKILEGVSTNPANPMFNPTGNVTVQELAKVLVEANKLEVPTGATNTASDWAKGYVAAAIKAGYIAEGINYQANATRSQTVVAAHAIYEFNNFKVTNAVAKDANNVTLTLSTGEVVEVKLETALKANEKTDLVYKAKDGRELKYNVTWVVTTATKVESATSTNLKEVEVVFDGEVDKATATDKDNYSINQGAKAVKSATLLEGGKSVRLLLADGHTFSQATDYTVQVKNVKAGTIVLSTASVKFTSADNTLPTVAEVKSLGKKAIKVTFSEPVRNVTSSNFRLDDKTFVGSTVKGANEREYILKDYTGDFTIGAHKLTSQLVEDYAGLKSVAATTEFTIVEDTEAPTVTEITATLEKITITFSEEIDPSSVNNDTFYWKSGDTKKTGKFTQISGNVYEVQFTPENRLPGYETTIFIDGVKDYSGNVMTVKEHKVTATVDLNRPKVIDVRYGVDSKDTLTVRFDKPVYADKIGYFSVKKGNDVFPVERVTYVGGTDNKVVELTFRPALSEGEYTLKVSGVEDRTILRNKVEDFTTTFKAIDSSTPAIKNINKVDVNESTRKVVVHFDKKMKMSELQNYSHYYLEVSKNGSSDVMKKALPSEVTIVPALEGRAVVLIFPEYIFDNIRTSFGPSGTVKILNLVGLTSDAGNLMDVSGRITLPSASSTTYAEVTDVKQTDYRTIEVEFNQPIEYAYSGDFDIYGATVSTATIKAEGNVVVLKSVEDLRSYNTSIGIKNNNAIKTYAGNGVLGKDYTNVSGAAPKVDKLKDEVFYFNNAGEFLIQFTPELAPDRFLTSYGDDLIIQREQAKNMPKLTNRADYSTEWTSKGIKVTLGATAFKDGNENYIGEFSVKVKDKAEYIRGNNGKLALQSDTFRVIRSGNLATPAEADNAVYTPASSAKVPAKAATATAGGLTFTAPEGTAGNAITVLIEADATMDVNTVVASALGNAVTIKFNGTVTLENAVKEISDKISFVKATGTGTDLTATAQAVSLTGGDNEIAEVPATLKLTFDKNVNKVAGIVLNGKDLITSGITADGTKVVTVKVPHAIASAMVLANSTTPLTSVTAQGVNGIGPVDFVAADITFN